MKKLVCLLLAFSMVFTLSTAFADEGYEVVSRTVLVDGAEYEANILAGYWGDVYIQIAPLARAFGCTVTYIEETDSVTFEKDGVYLELCIPESYEITTGNYIDVISYEDRTYVHYQYVEKIIDTLMPQSSEYFYDENVSYSYYTKEALIDEYKDKFSGYEKLLSIVQNGAYEETETADLSLTYNNDTFGVNITGGTKIKADSLFDNGAFKADIEISTQGLLNLLELFMQGEAVFENGENFNPEETISFSMLSDGKDIYIKGKPAELMISAEAPYFLEEEGWEEELQYAEKAKAGWVKLDTAENNTNGTMSAEGFVMSIAETDMEFETKKDILDITSYLYQCIYLALKETDEGVSYKITLDKAFAEMLAGFINAEITNVSEDFEIVIEEVYNNDLTGTSEISGKLVLDEVYENENNIDSGKLTIELNSNAARTPTEEKISAPDEFISIKELRESFDELYNEYWEMNEF